MVVHAQIYTYVFFYLCICVYSLYIHMTEIHAYMFVQINIRSIHCLKIQSCLGVSAKRARVRRSRDKRGYPRSSSSLQALTVAVRGTVGGPTWSSVSIYAALGVIHPDYFGCILPMPFPSQLLEWFICQNQLTSLASHGHSPSWVMLWGIGFLILS